MGLSLVSFLRLLSRRFFVFVFAFSDAPARVALRGLQGVVHGTRLKTNAGKYTHTQVRKKEREAASGRKRYMAIVWHALQPLVVGEIDIDADGNGGRKAHAVDPTCRGNCGQICCFEPSRCIDSFVRFLGGTKGRVCRNKFCRRFPRCFRSSSK